MPVCPPTSLCGIAITGRRCTGTSVSAYRRGRWRRTSRRKSSSKRCARWLGTSPGERPHGRGFCASPATRSRTTTQVAATARVAPRFARPGARSRLRRPFAGRTAAARGAGPAPSQRQSDAATGGPGGPLPAVRSGIEQQRDCRRSGDQSQRGRCAASSFSEAPQGSGRPRGA